MEQTTKVPFQYTGIGRLIKKALHTKLGAFVGYHLGLSGFNQVEAIITRANGSIERSVGYNARVDAGAALNASLISGTTLGGISSPAAAKYIALSTATLSPAKADTTLASEITTNGLGRALGTSGTYTAPSALDGAASYVLSKTFSATGTSTVVSAAIFDATSAGNMFVEANLSSSATVNNGDSLTISWTVNL
jgi:hypothetical protein